MVCSAGRFVLCLALCCFVFVFFSPFSIAITSLGEERANLSAFRTFVRFVLVWFCLFPLPLGIWERLRFVILAIPGLFSYLFLHPNTDNYGHITYLGSEDLGNIFFLKANYGNFKGIPKFIIVSFRS